MHRHPVGDEMFYRYQQALIDEAITPLGAILSPSSAIPAEMNKDLKMHQQKTAGVAKVTIRLS